MWFDKSREDTLFVDLYPREPEYVGKGRSARLFSCQPDEIADFRALPYPDASFKLVVFDPPHLIKAGKTSWLVKKYGKLDKATWSDDLRAGFKECFRVLAPDGVLVFKWNETDIPVSSILKLSPCSPLFGHQSGKRSRTHWLVFMKS